ncbi:MAG: hypothetical protein E7172_00475 [Firmicutes bacterium]|nr:hypothetical protein [Bacillota bacterium]
MAKIEIKNEKLFKNKIQMIIYIVIFSILFYLFIYLGSKDYSINVKDNVRFAQEFNQVSTDNVFKYVNASDVYMITSGKDGIVLFGKNNNDWVNYYAKIINEVAKEVGIKEIFYYDFYDDRNQNNGTYETIVNQLNKYVKYNDLNRAEIYAPTLLIIKNKKVLYFDDETSFINGLNEPKTYWNEYKLGLKKNELKTVFEKYLEV